MAHEVNAAAGAVISGAVLAWGLVSARLERWDVTAPIAFVVVGLVSSNGPISLIHLSLKSSTIRALAEITLALVLFADASRVHLKALRADIAVPARLLAIGLPLTIGAGAAVAWMFFSRMGFWVAAAIAAIVAPTDAALGAPILQDKRVPAAVRRALNVESGLNDGIATPFVNLFLAAALTSEAVHTPGVGQAAIDLLSGAGLGVAIGVGGAWLVALADRAGWSEASFRSLSVLALAPFVYALAVLADINGFVAAFVAGIAFGTAGTDDQHLLVFAEEAGNLMSLLVWFAFGAVMVVPGFKAADWQNVVFAVLVLTVVRMGAVAVALIGSGCDRSTVGFLGWFGPRGLASVVFGLIAVDTLAPADAQQVLSVVTVTVTMSVVLHGVSAAPLAQWYAKSMQAARLPADRGGHPPLATRCLPGSRRNGAAWQGSTAQPQRR